MTEGYRPKSAVGHTMRTGRHKLIEMMQAVKADDRQAARQGIVWLKDDLDHYAAENSIYPEELLTEQSAMGQLLHESFATAAVLGRTECLSAFLEGGVPVDQTSRNERETALMLACREGNIDCVRILLNHGASVSASNTSNDTAMFFAANPDIMQMLYDFGADVNDENFKLETPMFHVVMDTSGRTEVNLARLQWLLAHGTMLNHPDRDGATALIHACQRGSLEYVRVLVAAGARMDVTDPITGDGLLTSALFSKSIEMVRLIIQVAPQDLLSLWKTQAHYVAKAVKANDLELVKELLSHDWGLTRGHEVKSLPHSEGYCRNTPLHCAAAVNNIQMLEYILEVYASRDLSIHGDDLYTPLHHACLNKVYTNAACLLRHGACPTSRDPRHWLPLHMALECCYMELHAKVRGITVWELGSSLHTVVILLRHTDLYYLTQLDLSTLLIKIWGTLRTNNVLTDNQVAMYVEAALIYIQVLQAGISDKTSRYRELGLKIKMVTVSDSNGNSWDYMLDNSARWQHLIEMPSLRLLSRDSIRRKLHENVEKKISHLPLPRMMKHYVNLGELDYLVEEYIDLGIKSH